MPSESGPSSWEVWCALERFLIWCEALFFGITLCWRHMGSGGTGLRCWNGYTFSGFAIIIWIRGQAGSVWQSRLIWNQAAGRYGSFWGPRFALIYLTFVFYFLIFSIFVFFVRILYYFNKIYYVIWSSIFQSASHPPLCIAEGVASMRGDVVLIFFP